MYSIKNQFGYLLKAYVLFFSCIYFNINQCIAQKSGDISILNNLNNYDLIDKDKNVDPSIEFLKSFFKINDDGFVPLKNMENIEECWIENEKGKSILSIKNIDISQIDMSNFPTGQYTLRMRTKNALVIKYCLSKP